MGRGARGRAGAESLTGRCPGPGGRRLVLQEAHGHFQDIRLLQLRVAGALCPATRESDRKTDNQDTSPAGCLSTAILPGAGCPARSGPRWVGCYRPNPSGFCLGRRAEPPRRFLGQRHLGPPARPPRPASQDPHLRPPSASALTSLPSSGRMSPLSCFKLSLMRARRRFSSSGFKLCGRTPRPR